MARMFPTMVSDPNDPNRRHTAPVGPTWPTALRVAYWLSMAAAVLMVLTALLMLNAGVPEALDAQVAASFRTNMRIVAVANIVLALCLTASASYFERGSRAARRWAGLFVGLAVFVNFAGFYVQVASWASIAIVVILGVAMFALFRPAANAFVDERSGNPWRGVE